MYVPLEENTRIFFVLLSMIRSRPIWSTARFWFVGMGRLKEYEREYFCLNFVVIGETEGGDQRSLSIDLTMSVGTSELKARMTKHACDVGEIEEDAEEPINGFCCPPTGFFFLCLTKPKLRYPHNFN